MVVNFVEIEEAHHRFPEKWRRKFSGVDWSESLFVTYEINDDSFDTYEISTDGDFFGRKQDGGIEKLTDFTHKLNLDTGVILKEEDYELTLTAFVYKGELKDLAFEKAALVDRKERIQAQEDFKNILEKVRKKASKEVMKSKSLPYKVWKSFVSTPLTIIRYILGFLIKVCWVIEDLLT